MRNFETNCPGPSAEVVETVRRQLGETGGVLIEIRRCAGRFGRGLRAAGYERADVEQELALGCLQRFRRYDPRRSSPKTFINVVGRSRVASIVEKARAQKRDYRVCQASLNDIVLTSMGQVERIETVSTDTYEARLGRQSQPAEELLNLHIDVERAVARLVPELRVLAEALMVEESADAVARKLRLGRSTVYRRLGALRDNLQAAGLGRYVDSNTISMEVAA